MMALARLRAWLIGDCKSITHLVSEAQERGLSAREKLGLKRHLLVCTGCRNYSRQIPFLRQAMRAWAQGRDQPPGD